MSTRSLHTSFGGVFSGKRVFLTGHTGFKGSWLTEWLLLLGAEVHGYSLDPQPHEVLYDQLGLSSRIAADHRGDLNDLGKLSQALRDARPEIVLHLAAQPLVRLSYDIPVETFSTNVMGTVHLLEGVRQYGQPCSVVCITTDKCYENREWLHGYREEDAMGGYDPYSASKGCAELAIAAYRRSFFPTDGPIKIASARAGNVIGGGDWAKDRIIPDCFRALRAGQSIPVRNRIATRPWQHVLEPLSGYLWLAANIASPGLAQGIPVENYTSAFNFGPNLNSNRTVAELVQELLKHTGGEWTDASDPNAHHEASKLNLAIDKAFHLLRWQPVWNFEQTIKETSAWYTSTGNSTAPLDMTQQQITSYVAVAGAQGLAWAS